MELGFLKLLSVKIGAAVIGLISLITGTNNATENSTPEAIVGASPNSPALVDDILASDITKTATNMILATGAYRDGTPLSGYICFTLDVNTPSVEYVCGNASGTAITSLVRGISYSNPNATSSNLAFAHRRLASVTVTDYPQSEFNTRKINGVDAFSAPLFYDSSVTSTSFTSSSQVVSKEYVDNLYNGSSTGWLPSGTNIYNGNSGNVGIGTTTPAKKLTVDGTAEVTGATYLGGALTASGTITSNGALQVSGAANFSSSAVFNSTTTSQGTLNANGATNLASTTNISGPLTISTTTSVTGPATFSASTTFNGNISFSTTTTAYTNAVLWQYLGSVATSTSASNATATAAIVRVYGTIAGCTSGMGGEMVIFKTGKTDGRLNFAECNAVSGAEVSASWSGNTVTMGGGGSAAFTISAGNSNIFWFK